jgi:hypothetical protein
MKPKVLWFLKKFKILKLEVLLFVLKRFNKIGIISFTLKFFKNLNWRLLKNSNLHPRLVKTPCLAHIIKVWEQTKVSWASFQIEYIIVNDIHHDICLDNFCWKENCWNKYCLRNQYHDVLSKNDTQVKQWKIQNLIFMYRRL